MHNTPSAAVHAAPLPPLGAGIILKVELEERLATVTTDVPATQQRKGTAGNQFLVEPIITETLKEHNFTTAGDGTSAATTFPSPPPSPPSMCTLSPGGTSSKRGSGRFQSMDDSFCDRIRSSRPKALTKLAIQGAVAEFVVLDQQPFNVVEAPSFQNLLQVAANDIGLEAPSRHDVSTQVSAMVNSAQEKLRGMMKGTHPALTTDCWTSTSGEPFMALTAHWIPEDKPELTSTTLCCVEFRGSHTSDRLAQKIIEVMDQFDIKDSTVALTTDTAANIKKAGKQLLRPEWHGCLCHLLQLCALKILNEPHVKATFVKHNRLTNHLHSSTTSTDKLHALQRAAGKDERTIPTNCATRWNSTYEQGRVVLTNKFCVQQLCDILKTEKKLDLVYTDGDWANTSAVVELLELFCEATEVMQGDFITNSMVPMLASNLLVLCTTKASSMQLPQHIREVADKMFGDVEDRLYPPTNCAMIAAVCDPRVKRLQWCDKSEKKTYRDLTVDAMVAAMPAANAASKAPAAAGASDQPATPGQPATSTASTDRRKKKAVKKSSLLFAKLLAVSSLVAEDDDDEVVPQSPEAILAERKTAAGYELERYMQGEVLADTCSSQDVLDWWFGKRLVYPVLYRVACIYLAVPASSGSSERVFSTAGNIVTKKRNRLGADSVNNLVFLHGCQGVGWKVGDTNPRKKLRVST